MFKTKYIIGIIIIVLVVIVGILLWRYSANPAANPPTNGPDQTPDYILTDAQKEHFRLLVQNFVEGYNSYSYYDYRTLLDVQGNSTPALAAEIQRNIINKLQNDPTWQDYSVETVADPSTWAYRYSSADTFLAEMTASVSTKQNNATTSSKVRAKLTLIQRANGIWLLDKIILEKIN